MAAGSSGGEKSRFRCLNAARYAVASVVTALIVAVIVNAIAMVLRPGFLSLSVARGTVFFKPLPPRPPLNGEAIAFFIYLRAQSGSARMYYTNITAYLFDNKTSAALSDPKRYSIIYFLPRDTHLSQQSQMDSLLQVRASRRFLPPYFDLLYNGSRLSDVTMRLDGSLITETKTGINNTARPASYICGPLLFLGEQKWQASKNMQDVNCTDGQAWLFS